jgi:hypothetical protein
VLKSRADDPEIRVVAMFERRWVGFWTSPLAFETTTPSHTENAELISPRIP